jgi:hypothetical protein
MTHATLHFITAVFCGVAIFTTSKTFDRLAFLHKVAHLSASDAHFDLALVTHKKDVLPKFTTDGTLNLPDSLTLNCLMPFSTVGKSLNLQRLFPSSTFPYLNNIVTTNLSSTTIYHVAGPFMEFRDQTTSWLEFIPICCISNSKSEAFILAD